MSNIEKNGIKKFFNRILDKFKNKNISNNNDIFYIKNILILNTPYNIDNVISFLLKNKYMFFTKCTSSSINIIIYNIPSSKDFINKIMSMYNQSTGTLYVFGFQANIIKKNYIASFKCLYSNNHFLFEQNNTIFIEGNNLDSFLKGIIKYCNFSFQFISQYHHIKKIINNHIDKNNILSLLDISTNINKSEDQRMKARSILYGL